MDDFKLPESIALEVARGLVSLGALTDSPPVAMRYEAMALEVERIADRLAEDFHDPLSYSYRNKDTAEKVAGLRRTAPPRRSRASPPRSGATVNC